MCFPFDGQQLVAMTGDLAASTPQTMSMRPIASIFWGKSHWLPEQAPD
jgi:hypothetical protein